MTKLTQNQITILTSIANIEDIIVDNNIEQAQECRDLFESIGYDPDYAYLLGDGSWC